MNSAHATTGAQAAAEATAGTSGPRPARSEVWVAIACLAAGVALGALWVLVGDAVVRATDPQEQAVASDGTFTLLGMGFGVLSALLLAVLPGHREVLRAGVALLGSVLGGFIGLAVGLVLGAPLLRADGLVLAWPVTFAALTTLRLLVLHLLGRE